MWSFHKVDGTYLGQIPVDCQLHIGRTYSKSSIDLKITNIRVSRKQIFLRVDSDKLNCRVDGINPVYVYTRDKNVKCSLNSISLTAKKFGKGDRFQITHNEMIEFNIFKKQSAIKIVICKTGLPYSFNFSFPSIPLIPVLKRRRSLNDVMKITPNKLRRVSSTLGVQHTGNDSAEDVEEERLSIVDKLGSTFTYEKVLHDPEHNLAGGSRVGKEFQAILPKISENPPSLRSGMVHIELGSADIIAQTTENVLQHFKSSGKLRKLGVLSEKYILGLTMYTEYENLRNWSISDSNLFLEAIREYPKMFGLIADYMNRKQKASARPFTREQCNQYFYTQFKGSGEYRDWKESFQTRENLSAGVNMSYKIQSLLAEEMQKDMNDDDLGQSYEDEYEVKKRKIKKKPVFPKRKGKRSHEMLKLLEAGLLKAGPKALYLVYHGQRVEAELTKEGGILFNDQRFESASSWSYFAKKQLNPKVRSDNGWSSVHHEGHPLSYYRSLFDPGKGSSTSFSNAKNNVLKEQQLPKDFENFAPTLEDIPISAINSLLLGLSKQWTLVLPTEARAFNIRTSDGEFKGHLVLNDKGNFYVLDEDTSSRRYNSLYSWFKSKNMGNLDFFVDCQILSFATNESVDASFISIKRLYFNYWTLKIEAKQEQEEKQQKLLDGKRPTTFRLNLLSKGSNSKDIKPKSENWSKYDRYCICRKKYIESTDEDWFMQCSKGSSFCHGWVHPKCFGLLLEKEQSENLENFICPLCSLDTIELCKLKNGQVVSRPLEKPQDIRLSFKDMDSLVVFSSIERSQELEEGTVIKKRRVQYLPGTKIRSKQTENSVPTGWICGKIIKATSNPMVYVVRYEHQKEDNLIDLEHSSEHMLEKDWQQIGIFRLQNACWRKDAEARESSA